MTIKAILFDCDGTLVDTELMCARAFTDALKLYGVDCAPELMLTEFFGIPNTQIAEKLSARFGVALPEEPITKIYTDNVFATMAEQMRVLADSVAYVKGLKDRGFKLAVGSNGTKDVVVEELRVAGYLGDIIPRPLVFTAIDVANPKPAPDMYLMAAEACGVAPEECVVVEDSAAGARAGLAAGMRVVGYTGLAHDAAYSRQRLENAGVSRIIEVLPALDVHLL
ncbi:MAG: HAD family phosphatase [Alphaproteobacteria bacterium]|nr:HAD family phosphatase [Alphaproteobacteria bacterium]